MSIQSQSTLCFCRCLNATRPIRRLLLSGFPLVLTTRYFGIPLPLDLALTLARERVQLWRQKNFSGVRIFHRRARRETAHVDVTAVRRVRTRHQADFSRNRFSISQAIFFFPRRAGSASRIPIARRFSDGLALRAGV